MQVVELQKRTQSLPDDYLVVLVGDMITEEALPTYMAMLNTLDGVRDETGAAPTPWGRHAPPVAACLHAGACLLKFSSQMNCCRARGRTEETVSTNGVVLLLGCYQASSLLRGSRCSGICGISGVQVDQAVDCRREQAR